LVENLYQDIINDTMRDYKIINELTGKLRLGGGREEGGFTTLEFMRQLDFYAPSFDVIWSWGREDPLSSKELPIHTHRGSAQVNLFRTKVVYLNQVSGYQWLGFGKYLKPKIFQCVPIELLTYHHE